jgi:AcrR family transcriptional regulator
MGEAATGERRQRTDKQRNRTHILEVAEQFFAEQGITGSMDAIARKAGVGPGTLYRHFPNREALLAALLHARDEELEARRIAIQQMTDSRAALAQWLQALGEWATAFDGLPEPLRAALTEGTSPLATTCQGYITITDEFLHAAQRDGGAKSWVRGRDLFLSTLATAWARSAVLADESSPDGLSALVRSGWETPAEEATPHSDSSP